ncbi:protein BNIP5 [Acomys russatus]|uniref:protein BNIP5 n=1 Tax=Acomys russatus TaxID=60746 RepID=UPI0021E34109|nr:protein BNIP5 [Acomys russatus]
MTTEGRQDPTEGSRVSRAREEPAQGPAGRSVAPAAIISPRRPPARPSTHRPPAAAPSFPEPRRRRPGPAELRPPRPRPGRGYAAESPGPSARGTPGRPRERDAPPTPRTRRSSGSAVRAADACCSRGRAPAGDGHSPPSQPKENDTGQNRHQPEETWTVTMQLRRIGDSVNHRMIQEVRPPSPQQGPGQAPIFVGLYMYEQEAEDGIGSLELELELPRRGPVETRKGPRKLPADKRAQSLDRQVPRKDSESSNSRCPSGPSRRRTASDRARGSGSPPLFAEAQGTAALPPGEGSKLLPSDQGSPEDTKKERPLRQAQQSWVRIFLNLLLMRMEEPREKASRKSKGKAERSELPESAQEPGLRKKSQEKKTGRKKHGHRKPAAEEPPASQNAGVEGQEDTPPSLAMSHAEEADLGLICGGEPESELPQALPIEGSHADSADSPPSEEGPQKPDQDEIIWRIVEVLKKAGDQLEEEQTQVPQPEVAPQKLTPPPRKKSQEKKSSLKRALSLKRLVPEEPKRAGAAAALGPETRPKRPSFLPLCVNIRAASTSSSHDSEAPGSHEVLSIDDGASHPSELHTPAGCQGPSEKPPLDRASESREFRRKILALLQSSEEQKAEEQAQVQEAEEAGENPAPAGKVKARGKKGNLRRAFSLRKHSSKESKRKEASGTLDAASPEARQSKKHSFLPMCVAGHRASISSSPESLEFQEVEAAGAGPAGSPEEPFQAGSHTADEELSPEEALESKELIIHKLVARLQEVDRELGRQIRKYPSFKLFFNEFSDASLRKLVATLDRQKARLSEEGRSHASRPPPCAFGSLNKFAANHSCAICTLMQSRGQYKGHSYAHFLSRKAQQDIASLDGQSPD